MVYSIVEEVGTMKKTDKKIDWKKPKVTAIKVDPQEALLACDYATANQCKEGSVGVLA
jgi:hypothetical protein